MRFPADLWWRSLPLRVIASVFVASVLVLVLGGFLLMQQASSGVIKGKEQVASDEARQAVNNAQQTLNGADLSGDTANVDQLLLDLALSFANRSGDNEQFEVLLLAPGQFATGDVTPDSIPPDLLRAVEQSNDLLMTPTTMRYRDASRAVLDGYRLIPGRGCVSSEAGLMGFHFVNIAHLLDGRRDLEKPDYLLYAPTPV